MDNQLLQKIRDLVEKNDKISIAVGKNASIDAMAAALTLYLGLQEFGKQPSIASASQPLVEHSSLVGIDKVKAGLEGDAGGDLVVSFPYREGEIEKVSYTIESGYLNIVVKAGQQGLTFSESDVRFRRGGGGINLLFIIGTPRLSDLGSIFDPEALKSMTIINIDNHDDNQGFGDVPLIQPASASVSELVYEVLYALGIDLTVDMAQNILNGINDGTSYMQDPRVSYTTFEIVANLMKRGASRAQPAAPRMSSQQQPQRLQQNPFANRQQFGGTDSGSRFGGQAPLPRPQHMPQRSQGMQRPHMPRPQMPRRDMGQQQPAQSMQQPRGGYQQPDMGQDMPQPDITDRQEQNQQMGQRRDQGQGRRDQGQDRKPPSDWLQPKVYKGSSNV